MIPVAEKPAQQRAVGVASLAFQIRDDLLSTYADVFTPEVLAALSVLAHFNRDQKELMKARIQRRARRRDCPCRKNGHRRAGQRGRNAGV